MSTAKRRVFNREFKLLVVERLMGGERAIMLSRELRISPGRISEWYKRYRLQGAEGLRRAGRPQMEGSLPAAMKAKDVAAARQRIRDLERKIGQQQVELDFFRQALRRIGEARRRSDAPGVKASTR
jgi:transposase-like protein